MTNNVEFALRAADLTLEALERIHTETGFPIEAILAGAHAQLITLMVMQVGGPATAERCESAADQVRTMPSLQALSLAYSAPCGRA